MSHAEDRKLIAALREAGLYAEADEFEAALRATSSKHRASSQEDRILHETKNLYLIQTGKGLEIRLLGATTSIVVGSPKGVEAGKRAMERLERHPEHLRAMYDWRR